MDAPANAPVLKTLLAQTVLTNQSVFVY